MQLRAAFSESPALPASPSPAPLALAAGAPSVLPIEEPAQDPPQDPSGDAERLRKFGAAIDEVRTRMEARIGETDVRYVRNMDRFSRVMEAIGRILLHFSFEPITFTLGVLALWIHKQLQATEIGHTALHGAFDRLPGAENFQSKTFHWQVPIDEESWRRGHNIKHHQYTNIAGKDPDIEFGVVRLTHQTPHRREHYYQLPISLLVTWPHFGFFMNQHFTGLLDVYLGADRGHLDVLPDRSSKSIIGAHVRAFRKYLPYYGKEFLFFPLLAGPGFLKVLAGNWISDILRDIYTAATIYCGHVGEEVASYPAGTRARGRGEWYAMQVEATNNYEVSRPISVLCGALDKQIEHHLFPRFPTNRLREVAPEIRRICEEHGVEYRTGTWGNVLVKALRHIGRLSTPREVLRAGA